MTQPTNQTEPKTIRVVRGCFECKHVHAKGSEWAYCSVSQSVNSIKTFRENSAAITPSCPRYAETKLIETKE